VRRGGRAGRVRVGFESRKRGDAEGGSRKNSAEFYG